jgi:hypothetical protein
MLAMNARKSWSGGAALAAATLASPPGCQMLSVLLGATRTGDRPITALAILPFDEAALWYYGDLRADLERQTTPIGALNTLIAAHALSLQATLVTNNLKEFERVPGLLLDNWGNPGWGGSGRD